MTELPPTDTFPHILGFLANLRGWELLIILFAILLLFGAKKLPELARGIGKSMREFKKATSEAEETFKSALDAEPAAQPAATKADANNSAQKES